MVHRCRDRFGRGATALLGRLSLRGDRLVEILAIAVFLSAVGWFVGGGLARGRGYSVESILKWVVAAMIAATLLALVGRLAG